MMKSLQRLFNKDLKTLRSFQQRAARIANGSVIPKQPTPQMDLGKADQLDSCLAHVFIQVKKVYGMTPYECQLVGVMGLVEGKISQMQTGEGKTLVAAMAAVIMAASGRTVHLMTVNDYLVSRDAEFATSLANVYGVNVGALINDMPYDLKRMYYTECKLLYGTPSTFAFDYLRDGMVFDIDDQIQKEKLDVAIIDEVDSILIDEARVPMILSGKRELSTELLSYLLERLSSLSASSCNKSDAGDVKEHIAYLKDVNQVILTEKGYLEMERILLTDGILERSNDLYRSNDVALMPQIENCLQALFVYREGRDYIVNDGKVIIINPSTGRLEPDRRWGDGLHQAIEAKEGVEVKPSSYTQAKITMQAFSRLYSHLCGMTGTAVTDAAEFNDTYGLSVLEVPPHKPNQKKVMDDRLYLTVAAKNQGIVGAVTKAHKNGQPVLVGVSSLEEGERLSEIFKSSGLKHNLLTARSHEKEAEIIADAGMPGAITIATNMAGRGTDIMLGGHKPESQEELSEWRIKRQKVLNAGGLFVLGTARHDSRRIDLQLQGRAGRQGDPGSTVFYLSLEDRLFEQIKTGPMKMLFSLMGASENESISDPRVNRAIEKSQSVIQGRYRDQRIHLEKTDSVDENQRMAIRNVRQKWLEADNAKEEFLLLIEGWLDEVLYAYGLGRMDGVPLDQEGLESHLFETLGVKFHFEKLIEDYPDTAGQKAKEFLTQFFVENILYENGEMRAKHAILAAIDEEWSGQLELLQDLYQGVQWRSMAQRKPEQEYAREAFDSFNDMMKNITRKSISIAVKSFIFSHENESKHNAN